MPGLGAGVRNVRWLNKRLLLARVTMLVLGVALVICYEVARAAESRDVRPKGGVGPSYASRPVDLL